MSKLFLIRHAQASFLSKDYDNLSDHGHQQSLDLGTHFVKKGLILDKVYVGPLKRQIQTYQRVKEVYGNNGLPFPEAIILEELKEYEERDIKIQNEQVQRKIRRELLKKTNLYNTANDFIQIRVSNSPLGNGYSNTRTIFYLGEFAKYFFSKCELQIDNPIKIRLQELLKSDINYKNAYDYSKSRIISVQIPDREELTFLMAEFIIFLDEDFYENYEFVCNSFLKLSKTDYLEQLTPSEKIITMFIINEIEINILKKDDKVCIHSNNNNLVKAFYCL